MPTGVAQAIVAGPDPVTGGLYLSPFLPVGFNALHGNRQTPTPGGLVDLIAMAMGLNRHQAAALWIPSTGVSQCPSYPRRVFHRCASFGNTHNQCILLILNYFFILRYIQFPITNKIRTFISRTARAITGRVAPGYDRATLMLLSGGKDQT
jgi:hypothetical protein